MNILSSDVTIVGGGPAGAATALALRAHAPVLSIVLLEASRYEGPRIGESLPPPARALLEALDVWPAFAALGARESFGTVSIWGEPGPVDNDFIFMMAGNGWQLERAAFDAMLGAEAQKRGARVMLGAPLVAAEKTGEKWLLSLVNSCQVSTRFVVDATGGAASFARVAGARFVDLDRLVGISRFFECGSRDPRVVVETFADGWWYTAGLPNGRRVACCVTDADVAQRLKLSDATVWEQQLKQTRNVAAALQAGEVCGPVSVRSTNSRLLSPVRGDAWLAVGDAASRFDPLSSQGISKALRSGIFAAYAIGDWLVQADDAGLRRYQHYVTQEFKSYAKTRGKYYRQEQRWPTSDFWRRRHVAETSLI